MAIDNKHVRQPQFSSVNDSNIKKFIIDKIEYNITKLGTVFHFNTDIRRVDTVNDLPSNADIATIIMVGSEDALEYDEYFYSPNGKWELMGTCKTSLDGITTDEVLFAGNKGLGTIEEPVEGTILYNVFNKFNTLNIQSQLDSITDENTGLLKQSKDYSDLMNTECSNRLSIIEENINTNITSEDISEIVTDDILITKPTIEISQTYSGNVLNAVDSINGYDSTKMTISGDTTAINAGTYSASITPKEGYCWDDNTTDAITLTWIINKADNTVSVDKNNISLGISTVTDTITVSRLGTGNITAISNNTDIATVSVSDNIITVNGLKNGNTTITISVDGDNNYNKPDDIVVNVEYILPDRILANNTPDIIKQVSDSGQAANYWSAGDTIPITLSGTVGNTAISGTYYATILGINHNTSKEDSTGIDFIIGKDSNMIDIAFCDSNYNNYYSNGGRMVMNTTSTNSGGWGSSYMNTTICTQFLNIMPTEWQSAIKSAKKYTDNTGGGSDSASNITLSQSKIWLLSEYEVQGTITFANSTEQNYQLQYDYYKNGNSKIRYNHTNTSKAVYWWLRSPYYDYSYHFCYVTADGSANYGSASYSYGFAPCFRI